MTEFFGHVRGGTTTYVGGDGNTITECRHILIYFGEDVSRCIEQFWREHRGDFVVVPITAYGMAPRSELCTATSLLEALRTLTIEPNGVVAQQWKAVNPLASRISVPIPSFLAVSWAMASASPVTILTFTPICRAVAMVALASSRGGSNRGSTPRNCHLPSPSARATPNERKPRTANSLTAFSTAGFTSAALADKAKITCGAPFATLNAFPSGPVTAASVRLCTGSKGWKWPTL
jgi:hypothetical protein